MKSAKQFSGTSTSKTGTFYHAVPSSAAKSSKQSKSEETDRSPVQSDRTQHKKPSFSLKAPTITSEKFKSLGSLVDLPGFDVPSFANKNVKLFTVNTGLTSDEPVVVFTSEFRPLYTGNSKNELGDTLALKEAAGIVNANTAITILSTNEDAKDAVNQNREKITQFFKTEDAGIVQLMKELNGALNALDVSSFVIPTKKIDGFDSVGSFYEILIKGGYADKNIVKYTESKIWQQTLVELKKTVTVHTPELVSQKFTRKSTPVEEDPFRLSDVIDPPTELKRYWINPYYDDLPTVGNLTNFGLISSNSQKLLNFHNSQFINFPHANAPKKVNRQDMTKRGKTPKSQGNVSGQQQLTGPTTLVPFESSGRDISILSHILFREASYSSFLLDDENQNILASRYGFTLDLNGQNMSVWDHIIGKFPKSVLDFDSNPTGTGNSLVSFSQKSVNNGKDTHNILTFENNFIEGSNVTPGSYYYVDSAMNSADGINFETTRLEELITSTSVAHNSTKLMMDMLGYDIVPTEASLEGVKEKYKIKNTKEEIDLIEMIDKLSLVTKVYKNYMITFDNKISIAGGVRQMSTANKDLLSVRFAAIICKAAIDPSENYKIVSPSLKTLLFIWLMNIVIQKSEGTGNQITINYARNALIQAIAGVSSGQNKSQIIKAQEEGRTFPTSVSNTSNDKIEFTDQLDSSLLFNYEEGSFYEILTDVFLKNAEDKANAKLEAERKQAFDAYYATVSQRIFELNENKGLWRVMVDLLRSVYDSSNIYTSEDVTAYTGINRMAYVYSYFDLILRIISAQTPENLLGKYEDTFSYGLGPIVTDLPGAEEANKLVDQVLGYESGVYIPDQITTDRPTITVSEVGLLIDKTNSSALSLVYDTDRLKAPVKDFVRKLSDAVKFINAERTLSVREVAVFRKYFTNLNKSLISFKDYLDKNFESHLTNVKGLFERDKALSQDQKNALVNLTLSEEQLKMTRYIMSEYTDRARPDDSSAKLRSLPAFSTFPEGYYDFLSTNETDHISYTLLSSFFKGSDFQPRQGNNKRIVSVGIPQKLIRTLNTSVRMSSDTAKGLRQGIIRLKVWKLDKLHPDVVFLPKSYLFEMNRFPTRILSNWDFDAFDDNLFNLLEIPSKVMYPDGKLQVNKDFNEAFNEGDYGEFLTENNKAEIYSNHSMSFLMEEYLRWFVDSHLDETRYHNYTPLSPDMKNVTAQYKKYVESARLAASKKSELILPEEDYSKPGSGYKTSSKGMKGSKLSLKKSAISVIAKNKTIVKKTVEELQKTKPKTSFVIPVDGTIEKFFENETYMSDPDEFKIRAMYPKKFDRVFNLLIDPDDFYVDPSMTDERTLNDLVSQKVLELTKGSTTVVTPKGNKRYRNYKHRNTSQRDVWLDEYFVTVEPFDYVQEYED